MIWQFRRRVSRVPTTVWRWVTHLHPVLRNLEWRFSMRRSRPPQGWIRYCLRRIGSSAPGLQTRAGFSSGSCSYCEGADRTTAILLVDGTTRSLRLMREWPSLCRHDGGVHFIGALLHSSAKPSVRAERDLPDHDGIRDPSFRAAFSELLEQSCVGAELVERQRREGDDSEPDRDIPERCRLHSR